MMIDDPSVTEIKYSVSIKQCIVMPVQAYVGDKVIAAIELHVSPHMQGRNQAVEGIIKPKKLWMGEIYRMWTAPDYRRQGIMTKLLQICKEGAAIPDGGIMHRLITSVEDSTEQGKAFLRHHGFGYSRSGLEWVRGSDKL